MAPIPVKFVVSFSSQDPRHPVENLLKPDSTVKWLCASGDRSGTLEAVFQLERACKLSHVDLGTWWAFCAQVLVGRSSWPQDREYELLIAAANFMSPADCRSGKNKAGVRMFKYDDFQASTRDEQWDRVKVVATQPFRKDAQFGLSVLRLVTDDADASSAVVMKSQAPNKTQEKGKNSSEGMGTPKQHVKSDLHSPNGRLTAKPTPPRSARDIKEHFFGKQKQREGRAEKLEAQMLKLNASAENGSESAAGLPRHAQLVMTAISRTPQYKTSSGAQCAGTIAPRKKKLTFSQEADEFLNGIDVKTLDLDKVTFADLRHRLEKKKVRKLTKEEKGVFIKSAQSFVQRLVEEQQENVTCKAVSPSEASKDIYVVGSSPGSRHQGVKEVKRKGDFHQGSECTPLKRKNVYVIGDDSESSPSTPLKRNNVFLIRDDPGSPTSTPNNSEMIHPAKRRNVHVTGSEFSPTSTCTPGAQYRPSPQGEQDYCGKGTSYISSSSSPGVNHSGRKSSQRGGKAGRGKRNSSRKSMSDEADADYLDTWLSAVDGPSPVMAKSSASSKNRETKGRVPRQGPTQGETNCTSARRTESDTAKCNKASAPPSPPSVIDGKVVCPLCNGLFPPHLVAVHASSCGVVISSDNDSDGEVEYVKSSSGKPGAGNVEGVDCPMCGGTFSVMDIDEHADQCAEISALRESQYVTW